MNIKKGDVLKHKFRDGNIKVLGIFEDLYVLSELNDYKRCIGLYTKEQMEEYFDLPKEKWTPKEGEIVWYIGSNLCVLWMNFNQSYRFDEERMACGNCFQTESEAQAMADKFKALLANRE